MQVREIIDAQGRKLIEPVTCVDLFRHCSGGSIAVIPEVFNKEVKPLLILHGIKCIEYRK